MSPDDPALLERFAAQLLAAVAEGSLIHETEAFRIHLWPTPDPFYRNVAVPVRPAADWPRAIAAMRRVFAAHGRTPRLEFFAELWPGLEAALEDQGFVPERRAAVMARGPGTVAGGEAAGPRPVLLTGDASLPLLATFFAGAFEAFAEPLAPATCEAEVARLAAGLRGGTIRAAAVLADGRPVSGASLIGVGPVAELAGVWTSPAWRRRGLAAAACASLLARLFAEGGELVWLSAVDAAAAALYRRLGFGTCGTQLNHVAPATLPDERRSVPPAGAALP